MAISEGKSARGKDSRREGMRGRPRTAVMDVDFLARLHTLVESNVAGLDAAGKAEILEAAAERLRSEQHMISCQLVPFIPGWRPTDEASHPWMGSSDQVALILGEDAVENVSYLLFDVEGEEGANVGLDVTLTFSGIDGSMRAQPIPSWDRRPVQPMAFEPAADDRPGLGPIELNPREGQRLALGLSPERDLLPGALVVVDRARQCGPRRHDRRG